MSNRTKADSAVRTAKVLAALAAQPDGASWAYELFRVGGTGLSLSVITRCLTRLEHDGVLRSWYETQDGSPARRVFVARNRHDASTLGR